MTNPTLTTEQLNALDALIVAIGKCTACDLWDTAPFTIDDGALIVGRFHDLTYDAHDEASA